MADSTTLGYLLYLLDHNGPQTTDALADAVMLGNRLVWGLLKTARKTGQVAYDGHLWGINRDWVPPAPLAQPAGLSCQRCDDGYVVVAKYPTLRDAQAAHQVLAVGAT